MTRKTTVKYHTRGVRNADNTGIYQCYLPTRFANISAVLMNEVLVLAAPVVKELLSR
jgi:hypothetical protein